VDREVGLHERTALLFQFGHDILDALGSVARTHESGVAGLDHDRVGQAHAGERPPLADEQIALAILGHDVTLDDVCGRVLITDAVNGLPVAEIVPGKVRRHHGRIPDLLDDAVIH